MIVYKGISGGIEIVQAQIFFLLAKKWRELWMMVFQPFDCVFVKKNQVNINITLCNIKEYLEKNQYISLCAVRSNPCRACKLRARCLGVVTRWTYTN